MPFPAYSHLKEKDLKKMSQKLHLRTNGGKKAMIKRHREFVLRHNAQIDAYLNGNEFVSDREISRHINNGESKQIHSNFFSQPLNNAKNREKRKNQSEQLFKKLIKELKARMGKKWCRKRKKF